MTSAELYREGRLNAAIQALGVELRDNPADQKRRTFLFELLCFAGEYDRAEKHLDVLAGGGPDALTGSLLYRAAMAAERTRNDLFARKDYPSTEAEPVSGTLNGKPFESLEDADSRIGPRLEVYAAGQYMWMPFEHIQTVRLEAPKLLRDLLWARAIVRPAESFKGLEFGEALIPAIAPLTWQHPDGAIRLGRATEWVEFEDGSQGPVGQKMLLVDDEEFPILELRELEILPPDAAPSA